MRTSEILRAAARALATPGGRPPRLRRVAVLDGSPRTRVVRARLDDDAAGLKAGSTVVVKAHVEATVWSSELREPAALDLLTGLDGGHGPRLVAVADDSPVMVLEDLGSGLPDVADALLGTDPGQAESAVLAWARATGRLHAATVGADEAFDRALHRHAGRLGRPTPPVEDMPSALLIAAEKWADLLPGIGIEARAETLEAMRGLTALLGGGPDARALTPSDACPDNNVLRAGVLVLLDFEGAQVRHVAWDVAYLRVPWPSCWCSWRLPDDVARRAQHVWTEQVAGVVPYVRTPAFTRDLEVAEAGWAAISVGWFLDGALTGSGRATRRTPGRRALIQHRLGRLTQLTDPRLAPLVATAALLRAELGRRWQTTSLDLARPFRR